MVFIFTNCQNEVCNCPIDAAKIKTNDSIFTLVKKYRENDSFWQQLKEPYLDTLQNEVFRVYKRGIFDNLIKTHRIEKKENDYQLTIKNYYFGKPDSISTIIRSISKEQWDNISEKMNEYCFWVMDTKMNRNGCLDEGVLFLEGYNPNLKCKEIKPYHCVFGSCVDSLKGYKYKELCGMMFDLDEDILKR